MKKIISVIVLVVVASMAYTQIDPDIAFAQEIIKERQTRIWNVIQMSKEANHGNGIENPNRIFPDQSLTFLFEDGFDTTIRVKEGDSQWKILSENMDNLQKAHGPVVPYYKEPETKAIEPDLVISYYVPTFWDYVEENLLWILAGFLFLVFIIAHFWKANADKDPATSGTPLVKNGVDNQGARRHMQTVAERTLGGPNVRLVGPIESGLLSARNGKVMFADGEKRRNFVNEPAFRCQATVDDREPEYIYFLRRCGNDARQGHYLVAKNDFIWTPDAVQPEALQTSNQEAERAERAEENQLEHNLVFPADPSEIINGAIEALMKEEGIGRAKFNFNDFEVEIEYSRKTIKSKS